MWSEGQIVMAVLMATNGSSAQEISDATGKPVWQVRRKLDFHGVSLISRGTRTARIVPVCLSGLIHDAFDREASRRGFSIGALVARVAEITATDSLFDAVLGDHRGGV